MAETPFPIRPPFEWHGAAYSSLARWLTNVPLLVSAVSLPLLLLLVVVMNDPPITPPVLFRLFGFMVVLPAALAWFLREARAADLAVRDDNLVIRHRRRGLRFEVPCESIAAIEVWRIPLPGPGFTVRLRSGRRLRDAVQSAEIESLLQALLEVGAEPASAALAHPSVVFAQARSAIGPTRWYHRCGKFALFGLLPAAVLFNAHQHIAYGGLLGEYYLLGLPAYLRTLGIYLGTVVIYLMLYASVWRGLVEIVSLAAAWWAAAAARRVRRVAEVVAALLYYVGVPVLLGLRFLE